MKKIKITFLILITFILILLNFSTVFASNSGWFILLRDCISMKEEKNYLVKAGDEIAISPDIYGSRETYTCYYYFQDYAGNKTDVKKVEYPSGTKYIYLDVPAGTNNTITTLYIKKRGGTSYYPFYLKYTSATIVDPIITGYIDGKELTPGETYDLEIDSKIVLKGPEALTESITYYWLYDEGNIKNVTGSYVEVGVPSNYVFGQTEQLVVSGHFTDESDGYFHPVYYINLVPAAEKILSTKLNGTVLTVNQTVSTKVGSSIEVSATPSNKVSKLYYAWDSTSSSKQVSNSKTTLTIPTSFSEGSTHSLYVKAEYADGNVLSWQKYSFIIPVTEEIEEYEKSLLAKLDGVTLKANQTVSAKVGSSIEISAAPTDKVTKLYYAWDSTSSSTQVSNSKTTLTVPTSFSEDSTHILYIRAGFEDGTILSWQKYTFEIFKNEVVNNDEKLDLPKYLLENNTNENVLVSLRTSTDSEKLNYNIYALNEKVTYYIDYKNAGNDINSKVILKLEIPLDYTLVSLEGGTPKDGYIEWSFESGLKKGEVGTKKVVLKYKKLSKTKLKAEVIYPTATLYRSSTLLDSSAVINYIYLNTDTTIDDVHEPYMFGDAGTNTFRPDSGLSRAEAAIVLTRIYNFDIKNANITGKYKDIGTTYEEAQKAISVATYNGIIKGYEEEDGTYTYRPNEKIKVSEFLTLIARCVSSKTNEENIIGFDVDQNVLNEVWGYSNNYSNLKSIDSMEWYVPYVTLLVRLNMTNISEENSKLDFDREITRAEVAQIVNFALLRAPAEITNNTEFAFTDVSKEHALIADIIEATRDAHEYTLTKYASEIASN